MNAAFSHRPAGRRHPYRYDLDQRVPVDLVGLVLGSKYEIRVFADPGVSEVRVEFGGGAVVAAQRVDQATVTIDVGAPPARPRPRRRGR